MDKLSNLFKALKLNNINDTEKAWDNIKAMIKQKKLEILSLDTPINPNKVLINYEQFCFDYFIYYLFY